MNYVYGVYRRRGGVAQAGSANSAIVVFLSIIVMVKSHGKG